jgi:MscS family membrane protein
MRVSNWVTQRSGWTTAACTGLLVALWALAAVLNASQLPAPPVAADPYGRETPRGTVLGFTFAAHRRDYESAAHYLQVTDDQRSDTTSLVRELESLIDRYYTQRLTSMSASRDGSGRDGLPRDRERMALSIGAGTVDILLVRINDPASGPVWLFSSESLARMASFRNVEHATWIERVMPGVFIRHSVVGLSLGQWLIWILSIAAPLVALLMSGALIAHVLKRRGARFAGVELWSRELRWPATIAITILVHWLVVLSLGMAFTVRVTYARWLLAVFLLVSAWFVWRFLGLSFERARGLAFRRQQSGIASLTLLVERVAKAAVVLVVVLGLLRMAGLDTTTALAGVGLGGIALALGAQKSVENLLGGVFLLADGALAVGDFCSISQRSGWVEDITLRSVRLRTVEQTLVSIPAGVLAQTTFENFVTRGKMLIKSILPLQCEASAAQVEAVLEGIRRRLATDRDLEAGTSRVQLVKLGPAAIELELYAYVCTSDNTTFMRVRERLLLDAFSIVESAGARFARPAETVLASEEPSRQTTT